MWHLFSSVRNVEVLRFFCYTSRCACEFIASIHLGQWSVTFYFFPGPFWFRKCALVEPRNWKDLACLYGAHCFTENSPPHYPLVLEQVQTMDCGMGSLSPSNTLVHSLWRVYLHVNGKFYWTYEQSLHLNFTLVEFEKKKKKELYISWFVDWF